MHWHAPRRDVPERDNPHGGKRPPPNPSAPAKAGAQEPRTRSDVALLDPGFPRSREHGKSLQRSHISQEEERDHAKTRRREGVPRGTA
jgi:hypothetical protein